MKTIEMLNRADVGGNTYKNNSLYYSKKANFYGVFPHCDNGFYILNNIMNLDNWKKVFEVSETEKNILNSLQVDWIARDRNGNLFCYSHKPFKVIAAERWDSSIGVQCLSFCAFNHLFKMVEWEDKEPTLIADLLKEV
jgi:hypothetical protein